MWVRIFKKTTMTRPKGTEGKGEDQEMKKNKLKLKGKEERNK
jgi:hypothetical protein